MGGAPKSLIELTSRLDKKRFNPIIVTSGEGEFTRQLKKNNLKYRIIPMGMWRKGKNIPRIPACLYAIYRLIRQENISLVHANTLWDNPYAYFPAHWRKIPTVCHIRSVPRPDMTRKYFLNNTNRLICVSGFIEKSLTDCGLKNMQVIYNGINLAYAEHSGDTCAIRSKLGFSPKHLVVGLVSRLDPLKGQEILIKAASRLVNKFPQARFLIVGEAKTKTPEYADYLKKMVADAGLSPYFVFTGYCNNIMELTAAIDISVLPSLDEGFGRTNLEAMLIKKPVVSTYIGGIPEVVEDNVTGFLIPPDDADALSYRLLQLLSDKKLRYRMGNAGYKRVIQRFDLAKQAAKIERVYEGLIG